MPFLTPADLALFAPSLDADLAAAMIEDAEALAVSYAPGLASPDDLSDPQRAAVKAILRGAILRWHDSGSGALAQETVGPFSQTFDTRQARKGMFWPSEITQLQDICSDGREAGGAFSIDTAPTGVPVTHLDTCSLRFGGDCSCGAVLVEWSAW